MRLLATLLLAGSLSSPVHAQWLEKYDCLSPGDRWQHAGEAIQDIIAAAATRVDDQSVFELGFDHGSFAMSAIGLGLRFLGHYFALYVSPAEALNAILIPLSCHRIPT